MAALIKIEKCQNNKRIKLHLLGIKINVFPNKGLDYYLHKMFGEKNFNELQKMQISREVFASNIVREVHTKTFPRYKNSNENREVVLVASGPTMSYYKPLRGAKHAGVNKSFKNINIKYDYLFAQDYSATSSVLEEMLKYPAEKFLGSFLQDNIYSNLNGTVIPEKYFTDNRINRYYSDVGRNLSWPCLEYCGLMDYGSVVFAAAQFILYTHPKRVYLVGCDCGGNGYYDGTKSKAASYSYLIEGWKKMKSYKDLYYPDVEIVSINPVGLKGLFKDVYTKAYAEKINLDTQSGNYTIIEESLIHHIQE